MHARSIAARARTLVALPLAQLHRLLVRVARGLRARRRAAPAAEASRRASQRGGGGGGGGDKRAMQQHTDPHAQQAHGQAMKQSVHGLPLMRYRSRIFLRRDAA